MKPPFPARHRRLRPLSWQTASVKTLRWSGWALLALVPAFLVTGYMISGRYGLGRFLDERSALALHKALHLPLLFCTLAHALPAVYLALQRWGWLRKPGNGSAAAVPPP